MNSINNLYLSKRSTELRFVLISVIICSLLWGACCRGPQGPVGPRGPRGLSPVIMVPDDAKTIQQAIDSLPSTGGTVYIKAGIYVLSRGIHLNQSNVTLKGEQGVLVKLADHVNQPVLLIGTDEQTATVTIENITISDMEIDGNKDSQDRETDPERPWIRNNGIDIRKVNDLRMSAVDVHDAISGGIVASWGCNRIFLCNSCLHHNFFDGIALYDSEDILVCDFMCYENGAAGLSLDIKLKHASFDNGSVKNNGDVGIFVRDSEDLSFHDLLIYGNGSHGCFLSHHELGTNTGVKRLFFESCSFLDNDGWGLYLASPTSESPNNSVVGCLFSGNTLGAIKIDEEGELYQEANIFQ